MENVCISTKEGYSFFIEGNKDFVFFETGRPIIGSDIAKILNISRMAVSQALKRALKKIYYLLKKNNRHLDPFEVAVIISQMFSVSLDSDTEMNKFFNLFPKDLKKEIKTHAKNHVSYCSQCPFKTLCELF